MDNYTIQILILWRAWQEAQGLSERTIQSRDDTIRHFCQTMNVAALQITADQVVLYLSRPGIAQGTKSTYHKHLRAFHRWLIKTGRREDNPMLDTPQPKQPKGLPRPVAERDLGRMLGAVNRRRTRMMIQLAALQGLRGHEVAKFHGQDIDLADMSVRVVGKGGKVAILPLHPEIAAGASAFPADGYWFPSYTRPGEPITRDAVTRAIGDTMRRAGVVGRTPHSLRHWYGTNLLKEGVDVRVVQELMRHESLATTEIYTQVADDQKRIGLHRLKLPDTIPA